MFKLMRPKEFKLSWREYIFLILYTIVIAFTAVIIHETAHVLLAMALGIPFVELQPGFMWINPSIILPEWFTSPHRTIVYYAGGLATGTVLLVLYLWHWMRQYWRNPTFFRWCLGLVTLTLVSVQFAFGYLEGHYHGAYITGAMSLFSPANLLVYGCAVPAVFFHLALCPWRKMRTA